MVSRAAFAALLFTLSFLFYSDAISVPILVIASLLGGVFTAFTQAATQTYIFDIVGRERLSNAVALNATGSSLGQMGGPSLGGLLIAVFGVGATYLAGGSGYVIGLLALLFVRVPGKTARGGRSSLFQDVVEGLRYVRKDATVAWVLGLAPLTLFGGAMFALRPVFAREVLDVGSVGFGLLATSFGVGSLVASSLVGVFGLPKRRGITIIIAQIAWCIWMLLYSVNSWFPAAMAIEFCMAFGPQVWTATTQTVLQTQVPEEMRGRMVSLLFTAIQAFFVGQLLGGLVADLTSDRMALAILGAAPLPVYLYALLFAKPLHRI
jgi:MFS family permease